MNRYYLAPATFAFVAMTFAGVAVWRFSSGNFAGAGAMLFASAVNASGALYLWLGSRRAATADRRKALPNPKPRSLNRPSAPATIGGMTACHIRYDRYDLENEPFYDRDKVPFSLDMFRGLPPYLVLIIVLLMVLSAGLLGWSCGH